eukprot:TRINITY_DN2934_c0_g1_i1.p2 TRINITY_DN2934_c0_g1~~TRINITY_DN2934_c0_g1_i1.p2  ORF type:complete len:191 (+),score=34.72 TRINITY_DN2934_c0_g1_i1:1018-1590(+)
MKTTTEFLLEFLKSKMVEADNVSGTSPQNEREKKFTQFRNGNPRVLIATNLASRGLDILNVAHVVNYDFPREIEDYVHRIGRTGRAGKTGLSTSYFVPHDRNIAQQLINWFKEQGIKVPGFLSMLAASAITFNANQAPSLSNSTMNLNKNPSKKPNKKHNQKQQNGGENQSQKRSRNEEKPEKVTKRKLF